MSLSDACCSDVLQGPVLGLLDPSEVCQLAACSKELLHLVRSRRAAILLARHRLRMCLRGRRAVLQQRAFFVSHECKVDELGEQQLLQHNILQQLQVGAGLNLLPQECLLGLTSPCTDWHAVRHTYCVCYKAK